MRFVVVLALVSSLSAWAPLQCSRDPDPELRRRETPGEALYGLAQRFERHGDRASWRSTLEYLVERYPNSRFAKRAALDLEAGTSRPRSGGSP